MMKLVLACELVAARIGVEVPACRHFYRCEGGVEKSPGRMGLAAGAAGIGACFPVFLEGPAAMRAAAGALNRWRQFV